MPPEAENEDEGEGGGLAELPTSIAVSISEGDLRFDNDSSDYDLVHPGGDLIEFPFGFVEGETYTIDISALSGYEVSLHDSAEDGTEITENVTISEGSIELTVAEGAGHIFFMTTPVAEAVTVVDVIADLEEGKLTFIGDNVFSGTPSYNWASVTLNLVDLEAVSSSITLDGVTTAQHQGVDGTMGDGNLVATLPTGIIDAIGEKLVESVEIASRLHA